jgi:hypothetical protein
MRNPSQLRPIERLIIFSLRAKRGQTAAQIQVDVGAKTPAYLQSALRTLYLSGAIDSETDETGPSTRTDDLLGAGVATARIGQLSIWESVRDIFEEQLDGWYRVPGVWPTKRDLPTFQRWFEFSFHSMTVDLCDDVLGHEKL